MLKPCLATPAAELRRAAVRRSELALLRALGLLQARDNCAIVAIDDARPGVEAASIWSSRRIAASHALLVASQIRTPAPKLAWRRLLQLMFRERSGHLVVDGIAEWPGACALLKQAARRWRHTIVRNRKGLDLLCSDEHSELPDPVSAPRAAAPSGAP